MIGRTILAALAVLALPDLAMAQVASLTPAGYGSGQPALVPETVALLAAMEVKPTPERASLINATILREQIAGVWAALDVQYMLAAHDAGAALLNWRNPALYPLTVGAATVTFTTDRGYKGDGTTGWMQAADYQPGALTGLGYVQDAAHLGLWVRTAASYDSTTTRNDIYLAPSNFGRTSNNAAQVSWRITDNTTTKTVGTSAGYTVVVRASSSNRILYNAGASVASVSQASGSVTTAPGNTLQLFANNGATRSDSEISAVHAGGALSAAQVAALYAILGAYMTAVGAQ